MKKLNQKIKYTLKAWAGLALLAILGTGCKKDSFLLPDRMALDEGMWNDAGATQLFLNGTYSIIMPDYPFLVAANNVLYASDESILNWSDGTLRKAVGAGGARLLANDVKIIGSKQQGKARGENRYADIYRCNLALQQLDADNPIDVATKRSFRGQFFMLRAISYFDMVRAYGGVPLVLEPVDPANVALIPRSNAKACFDAIEADLDSAINNLNGIIHTAAEYGKLTHLAALSYKARVALYRASPLFNPTNYSGYTYDATLWNKALEINKAAYDLSVASGKKLMDNYANIFLTEGAANTEAIIVKPYAAEFPKRSHEIEYFSRPGGPTGGNSNDMFVATDSLINAYPMDDGTPIAKAGAAYDGYFFWKNRDPRFYATIAYNGSNWALNGVENRKQWTYANETEGGTKPFYCKRFSVSSLPAGSIRIVEDVGGNGVDWIELRFAEVLLNYAECLNETGSLADAKEKVKELRIKRGIKSGANNYGLAFATNKEQMRDLILSERRVEFAFEGKRGADLRRLRKMHLLSGTISASREKTNVIKKNNANYDLRLQLEEPYNGTRRRDTLDLNNRTTLQYFFTRIPNGAGNNGAPVSIPEYYYFYPIPDAFLLSSPTIQQTIGWPGGNFDPLK